MADRLRVLPKEDKEYYLSKLQTYAEQRKKDGRIENTFAPELLGCDIYRCVNGKILTQPEPEATRTRKGQKAQNEFHTIVKGVCAYIYRASYEQKDTFQKSVLRLPNPVAKGLHVLKMCQKDLF